MFLLDTDHIAIMQRRPQPEYGRLVQRMNQHPMTAVYFSIVSFHEQALGGNAYVSRASTAAGVVRGYDMLQDLLASYCAAQVLPFGPTAAAEFDTLRAQGIRIGTMDLRIAAIALTRNFVVLTRNLRDFRQVPGLTVEDWTV